VAEYDTTTNALQRRYVHGPGVDEPLVWYEGPGTTTKSWLYADPLGSIIATANAAGASTTINTYGPFGENAQTTPDNNRFGYTGQQHLKGLGLYHYKARVYSPALGRFLQTDPIGVADDLNLYGYVGNGPLNARDPSGLAVDWLKGATLSGVDIVGNHLENSWAAARNETFGSVIERTLAGLPAGGAAISAVGKIGAAGKTANQLGRAGEDAVRAANDIGPATEFVVNGRTRIADGINIVANTISEVKNVAYQYYSTQLKDYVAFAQNQGSQFQLFLRNPNAISPQLRQAVDAGLVKLGVIPKPPSGP
jgi:RHS repeat-associated protein